MIPGSLFPAHYRIIGGYPKVFPNSVYAQRPGVSVPVRKSPILTSPLGTPQSGPISIEAQKLNRTRNKHFGEFRRKLIVRMLEFNFRTEDYTKPPNGWAQD